MSFEAVFSLAMRKYNQGVYTSALNLFGRAQDPMWCAEEVGVPSRLTAMVGQARCFCELGQPEKALKLLQGVDVIAKKQDFSDYARSIIYLELARVAPEIDRELALDFAHQAKALASLAGDDVGLARAKEALALVKLRLLADDEAMEEYAEAAELYLAAGYDHGYLQVMEQVLIVQLSQHNYHDAVAVLQAMRQFSRKRQMWRTVAICQSRLAQMRLAAWYKQTVDRFTTQEASYEPY